MCPEAGVALVTILFMFVHHMEQFNIVCVCVTSVSAFNKTCLQAFRFALAYKPLTCLLGVPVLQGRRTASCFAPCFGLGLYSTPSIYTYIYNPRYILSVE